MLPLALAIGAVAGHTGELTLQTDRRTYDARPTSDEPPYFYEFTVLARVRNGTARPVQVKRRCPLTDAELQAKPVPDYDVPAVPEDTGSAYSPVTMCAEIVPTPVIVLQPGASRIDTLRIVGPSSWDHYTKRPVGNLSGHFRLTYELSPCAARLRCEHVLSNEFEVRLGR